MASVSSLLALMCALASAGAAGSSEEDTAAPDRAPTTPLRALAEEEAEIPNTEASTTVRGKRSIDENSTTTLSATLLDEEALNATPGLTLARQGGPLAPVAVHVRGLTGNRISTAIGPLVVDDPATGSFDLNALPWFALDQLRVSPLDSTGARLSFRMRSGDVAFARGRVGGGSFQTLRADLVAGAPLASTIDGTRAGEIVVAASTASTRGNFAFDVVTPTGLLIAQNIERQNNDQARLSALLLARSPKWSIGEADVDTETTIFVAGHRGGIPGFSTATSEVPYRGEQRTVAAATRVGVVWGPHHVGLSAQARVHDRAIEVGTTSSALASASGETRLDMGTTFALPLLQTKVAANGWMRGGGGTILSGEITRGQLAGGGSIDATVSDDTLRLGASSDVGTFSDGTLTTITTAHLDGGWRRGLRGGVRGSLVRRAPTLDELYAPRGLVAGNPELNPETLFDVDTFVRFAPRRVLFVEAAVFAGRIDDAIVYVSQNAFEVAPTNTGGAFRIGGEGRIDVRPSRLFAVDVVAQALVSSLDATGAPLPGVPAFSSRLHARVGESRGAALHATLRQRGEVSNTLFGTLVTPAYALADVSARMPLGDHIALNAAVNNLFDVKTAVDTNRLPLPGRSIFFTLEIFG